MQYIFRGRGLLVGVVATALLVAGAWAIQSGGDDQQAEARGFSDLSLPEFIDYEPAAVQGDPLDRPDQQDAILSDNLVTFEEFEAARADMIACAAGLGVEMDVQPAAGLRPTQIGFSAPTLQEAQADKALLEQCRQQYAARVEVTWALQDDTRTPEQTAAAYGSLDACLATTGVAELPESTSAVYIYEQLSAPPRESKQSEVSFRDAYLFCKEQVYQEQGYRLP